MYIYIYNIVIYISVDAVSIINYGSKSQAFLHQPQEDSDDEDNDLVQDMFGLGIQSESSTEASSLSERSSDEEAMLDDEECKSWYRGAYVSVITHVIRQLLITHIPVRLQLILYMSLNYR